MKFMFLVEECQAVAWSKNCPGHLPGQMRSTQHHFLLAADGCRDPGDRRYIRLVEAIDLSRIFRPAGSSLLPWCSQIWGSKHYKRLSWASSVYSKRMFHKDFCYLFICVMAVTEGLYHLFLLLLLLLFLFVIHVIYFVNFSYLLSISLRIDLSWRIVLH